jgi:cytochrome c556
MTRWLLMVCFAGLLSGGCERADDPVGDPPEGAQWLLEGSQGNRFVRIAKHLRGFDVAMVETGYRYGELHWAGRDRNWGYAEYQLGKIETAVSNGLERRPARADSARMLDGAVTTVRDAIAAQDGPAMDAALEGLTETCNACHEAERVPFIRVAPPNARLSPVDPGAHPSTDREQPR